MKHAVEQTTLAGSGLSSQADKANRLVIAADDLEGLGPDCDLAIPLYFDELHRFSTAATHIAEVVLAVIGLRILEVLFELLAPGVHMG